MNGRLQQLVRRFHAGSWSSSGAGASFGSSPAGDGATRYGRPPLTADLFNERFADFADQYPASRPAITRLRRALAADPDLLIEAEIGRLSEEAIADPERARHL